MTPEQRAEIQKGLQERLEAFIKENNISLDVIFTTPEGDRVSLLRAVKPEYLGNGWRATIIVLKND